MYQLSEIAKTKGVFPVPGPARAAGDPRPRHPQLLHRHLHAAHRRAEVEGRCRLQQYVPSTRSYTCLIIEPLTVLRYYIQHAFTTL